MNVFVKPNEQCRACSYIVMARIGNRPHGALGEVERQNALFKERQKNLNQELGIGQYEIYIQPFVDCFKKILLSAKVLTSLYELGLTLLTRYQPFLLPLFLLLN